MTTLTIELPGNAPVSAITELADKLGGDLRMVRVGHFKITPKEPSAKVIKFPAKPRAIQGGAA